MWKAKCVCGNVVTLTRGNLVSGNTKSCGCKKTSAVTKHGHKKKGSGNGYRGSRTYVCWTQIKQRCLNPKSQEWEHYGGRGITVCERWLKFENFLQDMGEAPEGMSIDRENNNLGYCKSNCRWIPMPEQQGNKRTNVRITINGITKHMSAWAREFGLEKRTVVSRRKNGWPDHLLFHPKGKTLKSLLSVHSETN